MFFKNALFYKITGDLPALTEDSFSALAFTPCQDRDISRSGWTPANPYSTELAYPCKTVTAVCMTREDRILPGAVVRQKLVAKIAQIEQAEGRKVYRKERESLKDELVFDLIPQAFTKRTRTHAYIDHDKGLLVVDTSTYRVAEELMKLLRETLGSLPAVPLQVTENPALIMTSWLLGEDMPGSFALGDWAKLGEQRSGGARANLDRQELTAEEVGAILNSGKVVSALRLTHDESTTFKLHSDLRIAGMRFSDELIAESKESADGDRKQEFRTDLLLMSRAIRGLHADLVAAFGGEGVAC